MLQIRLQNVNRTEQEIKHAVSEQFQEKWKPSALTSGPAGVHEYYQVVCVLCSDWSSEGLCEGSPWPLSMLSAANHI
jgi:hypothetical protein